MHFDFDFTNENIATLGSPYSLLRYYDTLSKYSQGVDIAYVSYCGSLPVLIASDNRQNVYKNEPGNRNLVYDHMLDRFYLFEIGNGGYSEPGIKVANVYNVRDITWDRRKWYQGNPDYRTWIHPGNPWNRKIEIRSNHSNGPVKGVELTISMSMNGQSVSFSGHGFYIDDAFNVAYANMRMTLLNNDCI